MGQGDTCISCAEMHLGLASHTHKSPADSTPVHWCCAEGTAQPMHRALPNLYRYAAPAKNMYIESQYSTVIALRDCTLAALCTTWLGGSHMQTPLLTALSC